MIADNDCAVIHYVLISLCFHLATEVTKNVLL